MPCGRRWMSEPRRVLIVNPFGIGDVLFSTPLIRAVHRAFPQSGIGYLCNRRTEGILREHPLLAELFVYEKDEVVQLARRSWWEALRYLGRLMRRIRRQRFDLAIDLSLGERYSFLLRALGVPRLVGFNYRGRGRFLTERLPIEGYQDEHVVEHYRKLLRFAGIRLGEASLELRVSETDGQWAQRRVRELQAAPAGPLVGLVPAGGASWGVDAPFRRWSFEGFAAVGDRLIERHHAFIVLFGEPSDRAVCATVARLMRHPVADLSGQTTLGQFIGLLGRMDLVICNDGGPLHLAVSQGVKTVSVFGPVDPRVYGPYAAVPSRHEVICRAELPCRPCYHQFRLPPCPYERACLTRIEPEDVLKACERLLAPQARAAGAEAHA